MISRALVDYNLLRKNETNETPTLLSQQPKDLSTNGTLFLVPLNLRNRRFCNLKSRLSS